ncbi:tetratricopeptide repeat protein [Psychrobacter sp. Marseille-P5312]|uniref:tetratricopeptide repeat protein n=1 Tax=Psychrobacter sp. Marseille-P5312 TaxID=2086574 RepID=UPI000CF6AE75|nr:tetratricopeptide repeat protein [Psychrobacter sp. Marseille-P5312]
MIFFGSLFRAPPALDERLSLRALLNLIIERLCQRYRLTLSLAVCLCLSAPVHASAIDIPAKVENQQNSASTLTSTATPSAGERLPETVDVQRLAPASIWQPELNEPSLYALLAAEFAADRDDKQRAVAIYKQQSFKKDATAVFERALSLSLQNESVGDSLQFAKTWQEQNPDHVPAWFYVAHLALRAHDYVLAGETLNRILRYDPRADLSEILIGIYPNTDADKRDLLAALQPLDSTQNASLSVLKAGLLYQFNEPEIAIVHINRALARQPDYVPFITLKADILRKIVTAETVANYLSQARLRNPDSKSLYLYEIRYLLDLKQSQEAWQLLLQAHERFREDAEITLLAALVSLDIEEYRSADELLNILAKSPAYLDRAYYYLGISAERQQRFEQAKHYLNAVMQEDLVLEARRKVVAFELLDDDVAAAISTLEKLRKQFSVFAPDTYVMQADILWQQNEPDEALRLLTRAARKYPDNEMLLFARAQLLDDKNDYIVKRTLLNHLRALDPSNLAYQLSYAQLLLANEPNSEQGLALATDIIQIRYDDPRYDNELHLQALNILASNALTNQRYQQVIDYLQTPYDVFPTLRSGTLLLRAYQGLGDNAKVEALLADLQKRFSFGQHNISDRIQLY